MWEQSHFGKVNGSMVTGIHRTERRELERLNKNTILNYKYEIVLSSLLNFFIKKKKKHD